VEESQEVVKLTSLSLKSIGSNITILLTFLCLPSFLFAKEGKYEFVKPLMGSSFRLVFYAANDSTARAAAESVFSHLDYLNEVMSDYLDGSETNRLSAQAGQGRWVKTSELLHAVLDSAQILSEKTGGAFDVTIGSSVQVWRKASRLNRFPTRREVKVGLRKCGYEYLDIDRRHHLVRLEKKGMRLDFGGIGKGYAADQGVRVLASLGIRSAMVDAGGDLALGDPPPGQRGWKISISSGPSAANEEVITIANCGVATSGATYRYLEYKGKKYSHILNPKTGVGLLNSVRATVVAPSATQADALATAVSVSGLVKSRQIQKAFPRTKFWILEHGTEQGHVVGEL
jgi:thiamine biosynthesis lipoprotein